MRATCIPVIVFAILTVGCSSLRGSDLAECQPAPSYSDEPAPLSVPDLEPVWTMRSDEATFSSPALADLNDDGVLDVVQGFGQDTLGARTSSVVATDGATGTELWTSTGHEDLIGTARFLSIGGDETVDVVIGGRRGALLAIDGSNGQVLWTFDDENDRWFNFYTPQPVDDQNGDGIDDLVASNGGLIFTEPSEVGVGPEEKRNLGTTFVVSGADGSVIARLPAPDRREQYSSPLLVPSTGGGAPDVLIGTGGETLPGAVWRVPLQSLVDEERDQFSEVVSGGEKGVIATPSLADLNGDCELDVVVQSFDGTVSAVDGSTNQLLWTVTNPGFETYSTPTLGYFVGDDDVPDVFVAVAAGVWPVYTSSDYLLIDGANGQVVWRETMGTFAPSGFVAADVNGDGRDEVIFGVNDIAANTHTLHVLDTTELTATALGDPLPQTTFSSPWLGDLDGDGFLDLIATESAYQLVYPEIGPASVHLFRLPWIAPGVVSWGGYLGTSTDGILANWM